MVDEMIHETVKDAESRMKGAILRWKKTSQESGQAAQPLPSLKKCT